MSLHFIPLGTGHLTSVLLPPTALVVGHDGRWLLVNCPGSILRMLHTTTAAAKVGLDLNRFDGVVLTSLHAHRIGGLQALARHRAAGNGSPVRLIAHPQLLRSLWDHTLSAAMGQVFTSRGSAREPRGLHDYFDVTTLSSSRPTQVGDFFIDCQEALHPVPSTSIRVRVGKDSVAYSSDTDVSKSLIQWLNEADTIVYEVDHGPGHTPVEALLKLPAQVRRKLRLTGVPDSQLESLEALEALEAARWYRS